MDSKKIFGMVLSVLLLFMGVENVIGQADVQKVGRYRYAQYDGTWFTEVNGQKGDLVDTKHLVVRLKDKTDIELFDFSSVNLPRMKDVRGEFADGFYELEIPGGVDGFDAARRLEETKVFDEVFFNVFVKVHANPNDQYYSSQWNLPKVSMPTAWDLTKGDTTVILAVIDVGADYNHEDLSGNCWTGIGYDFHDDDDDPYPSDGASHGTAVAGISGALTNNSSGVSGVAGGWNGDGGIRIMHFDAGWRDAYGDEWINISAAAESIDSATVWGAKVINMSFGGGDWPVLQSAINTAVNDSGVVCVASAGNYGQGQSTSVRYPAAYSNVFAVGATTPTDTRKELNDGTENWWGSCYGPQLFVMAPGVYIYTTDLSGSIGYSSGNYYDSFNGTSSSAPHIAGIAALIRSINPTFTWQQIRETIRLSVDKVSGMGGQNFTNEYGYGRIDANKAVRNLYVPQVYSTIQSALSAAVSGQVVVIDSGNQTLSSNINIPSGLTLKREANATISLNSYNITTSGSGAIIIEDGQYNVPDVRLQSGSTILGLYPSISSGLSASTTGQYVHARGPHTLSSDLTISSNKNLRIHGGANLTFNDYCEMYVYGKLDARGLIYKKITFNSADGTPNNSENAWLVRFNNSSGSELEYCKFQNAYRGIYVYNSNPDIENCEIKNCYYGIYANNSNITFHDNEINNCSYGMYNYYSNPDVRRNEFDYSSYGIYNYRSSPDIYSNELDGGAFGVRCVSYSSPQMCGYAVPGYNTITNNFMIGVYCESNLNPFMGNAYCEMHGYNSITGVGEVGLVYSTTYSTVFAEENWWGSSSPSSGWFSGDVDYIPYLTSPPEMEKQKSPEEIEFDIAFSDAGKNIDGGIVMSFFDPTWNLKQKTRFAHSLIYNGDPISAQTICKDIIASYPDSSLAFFALDLLWQASRQPNIRTGYNMAAFKTYLPTIANRVENKLLYGSAALLLAGFEGENGLTRIDNVFNNFRNTYLAEAALFQKFMYYLNDKEDEMEARKVLTTMDQFFPKSTYTLQAHHMLSDPVNWKESTISIMNNNTLQEVKIDLPEKYKLVGAFPNPFNPETSINYELPRLSQVEMTIFNMLGQKVKSFYVNSQNAGTHDIMWNGTNINGTRVPSGVYVVHFKATSLEGKDEVYEKSYKVTLLK